MSLPDCLLSLKQKGNPSEHDVATFYNGPKLPLLVGLIF